MNIKSLGVEVAAVSCMALGGSEASALCLWQAHRIQSIEQAQAEYEKRNKKFKPTANTAFNQRTLYKAYEHRTENIPYTQVWPSLPGLAFIGRWWRPAWSTA